MSRRAFVAVFACAALVVGLSPLAPAAAANPLSWAQESVVRGSASSRLVDDQSIAILCNTSATTDYSSIRFSVGGCGAGSTQVVLRPPSGGRYVAGQVISYSGPASITSWSQAPVQPADVASPCSSSAIAETVTVLAATHDGTGQLSSIALDYDIECGSWSGRSVGSVRWNDSTPYAVGGISAAFVAPAAMPIDRTEQVALPITVLGPAIRHITGVALGGDSRFTALTGDTCTGADLSSASTCTVTVSVDASSSPSASSAAAFVDLAVSSGPTIRVARSFALRPAMATPTVQPVPTPDGALVVVQGSAASDTASVLRRVHGTTTWTVLASGLAQPAWPDLLAYADTTAVPGTTYDYAARVSSAGSPSFDGPLGTASVVLPASSPTVTTRTRVVGQDHRAGAGAPSPTFASADTNSGQTAQVSRNGTRTTVTVVDASQSVVAGFAVGLLPGAGTYTGADLPDGWNAVLASTGCPSGPTDSLQVRSVLYDGAGALVALDASARMACSPLTRDLEIRFHTGDALAVPWPTPDHANLVADPAASSTVSVVTVTNPGPDTVSLGTRSLSGPGAASFSVGACSAATLAAGTSCTFSIVYHGAAAPTTDAAVVAIPVTAGSTSQLPISVTVSGRTADVPSAPSSVAATVEPGRAEVTWSAPADDGGRAVTSYIVQRTTTTDAAWLDVSTQPAAAGLNRFADPASPLEGAAYRVRAVTSRGASAPSAVANAAFDAVPAVMVGTWAERASSTAWGLYLGAYISDTPAPLETDGHEHENPSATPDGRAAIYSRAATPGAGQVDYDVYRLGFAPGATPLRLTDAPGAEVDAETSPDGARITYTHYATGGGFTTPEICLMPATGALGQLPGPCLGGYSHASWLTPGLVVASDDRTATGTLVRIPVSSIGFGTPTPLVAPTGQPGDVMAGASDPTVNPDGTRIAFVDSQDFPSVYETACGCVVRDSFAGVLNAAWFLPRWATPDQPAWAGSGPDGPVGATLPNGSQLVAGEVSGVPLPDTSAPVVGALSASYVRPGVVVHITVSDTGSPRGGVGLACVMDGGAPAACTDGLATAGLPAGHHQVHIAATDPSGNVTEADRTLTVDATPPTTTALSLPAYTLTTSTTAVFSAADSLSPLAYDLRYRSWPPSTVRPGGWAPTLTGLTSARRAIPVAAAGRTCMQVRARDAAGNVGAWSVERCTTRPIDDRALRTLDAGWVRTSGSAFLSRTATQTVRTGVRLVSLTGLSTRQVAVVATACPTCGAVSVWVAGIRVGTLNLRSSSTVARKIFVLPLGPARYGQLQLRTLSSRLVRIDAVIPLR